MKKMLMHKASRKPKPMQDSKAACAYFGSMLAFTLGPAELRRRMQANEPLNLIDVRRRPAFLEGHIPGALSMPKEFWESAKGLSKEMVNVFYCGTQQCHLAPEACLYFAKKGFPVMHLEGGMEAWKDYEYEVEETVEPSAIEAVAQDSVQAS